MKSLSTTQLLQATIFVLLALTLILHTHLSSTTASVSLLPPDQLLLLLSHHKILLLSLSWCSLLALLAYLSTRPYPVLLLDYSCHKPDHDRRSSFEVSVYFVRRSRRFSPDSEEFTKEIYQKSGLGDETYGPPFLFQTDYGAKFESAFQEAEEGMFSVVDSLLSKSRVHRSQIDVLIVACSMFTPCPSLTSLLVNHYGFKPSVKTFSLSGMGCSGGAVSVDLAAEILRRKSGYALIVMTESTSLNWYFGDYRPMIVTNCIFRVGTAAALLTSDPAASRGRGGPAAAKMELLRCLRTHHAADDASYGAALQEEDADGNVGVALKKDLVRVAGAGLRDHIRTLAPRVLPLSQLLYHAFAVARSAVWGNSSTTGGGGSGGGGGGGDHRGDRAEKPHVPDFTTAFEHMCIHPGGKAVINAVGRLMRLPEEVIEPARMTLHRFGNTSSSTVFYELAYLEAKGRVRKGDRTWMLAFGTGFKACSLVWRALRDSRSDPDNPWNDCIHRYPV